MIFSTIIPSGGGDYTTLASWEADILSDPTVPVVGSLEEAADGGQVTINPSNTNNVEIRMTVGVGFRFFDIDGWTCASVEGLAGRIIYSGTATERCVVVATDYVVVENFELAITGASGTPDVTYTISGSTNVVFRNCMGRADSGGVSRRVFHFEGASTAVIHNCIAYGSNLSVGVQSFGSGTSVSVYASVVAGPPTHSCYRAVTGGALSVDNSYGEYTWSGTITGDWNVGSAGTVPGGNSVDSIAAADFFVNVSSGSEDYRMDPANDGTYEGPDLTATIGAQDLAGVSRSDWDVGALEIASAVFSPYDPTTAWLVDLPVVPSLDDLQSNRIPVDSLQANADNSWLMFDSATAPFGGTLGERTRVRFRLHTSLWATAMASGLVACSTKVGNRDGQRDYAGADLDYIGLTLVESGAIPQMRIDEIYGGTITTTAFTGTLSLDTDYYVEMDFNPALGTHGRITATIWSNSFDGTVVESKTHDLTAAHDAWSYFYPFVGNNDDAAGAVSGTFAMDLLGVVDVPTPDSTELPTNGSEEDFTDHTAVDGGDVVYTIAANSLGVSNSDKRDDDYVYQDTFVNPVLNGSDIWGYCKINVPSGTDAGWFAWAMSVATQASHWFDITGDAIGGRIDIQAGATTFKLAATGKVDGADESGLLSTDALAIQKDWWLHFDWNGTTEVFTFSASEDHPLAVRRQATVSLSFVGTPEDLDVFHSFQSFGNPGAAAHFGSFTTTDMFWSFQVEAAGGGGFRRVGRFYNHRFIPRHREKPEQSRRIT
jgi:hypothetical protein